MSLGDLYSITEIKKDADVFHFVISLNPNHEIFKGHFPDNPVLPGVCALEIIKKCAEQISNEKLIYSDIISCKFLSMVNPQLDNKLILKVSLNKKEDGFSISAIGENADSAFIKLKAKSSSNKL